MDMTLSKPELVIDGEGVALQSMGSQRVNQLSEQLDIESWTPTDQMRPWRMTSDFSLLNIIWAIHDGMNLG